MTLQFFLEILKSHEIDVHFFYLESEEQRPGICAWRIMRTLAENTYGIHTTDRSYFLVPSPIPLTEQTEKGS